MWRSLRRIGVLGGVACAWIGPGAPAARAQTGAGAACAMIEGDRERLACYDRAHGRPSDRAATPAAPAPAAPPATAATTDTAAGLAGRSTLERRWGLDGDPGGANWAPRPYKPVYLLPATWTDRLNERPSSPSPGHTSLDGLVLREIEAKYQLSLKARFGEPLPGSPLALWGGYTQSSRWQVYNGAVSRPFRETNYEPELMLVWPLDRPLGGPLGSWRLRTAMLSLNHQSNGRSLPLSRSWNRVIASVAAERDGWAVELRPWLRIGEPAGSDDNPDIEDHVGRAELVAMHLWRDQVLTLQLRHSLRGGARSRGSAQLEWAFPLAGVLHGFVQWFSGYGESLIDYNHRANKVGVGISIAGWR
jgi:phospholipase A1